MVPKTLMAPWLLIPTSLGVFRARFGAEGLERLLLPSRDRPPPPTLPPGPALDLRFQILAGELNAYAGGSREVFRTTLALRGTPFQLAVWKAVAAIPYGSLISYAEIALAVGGSARAVGGANGANPVPILIPCHRVVGSDGSLTGYGGGLGLKRRLLELEGALLPLG